MRSVLILSDLFPDQAHPSRGIFVLEQAKELAKLADITVIAPVANPIPRKKFRAIREVNSHIPHTGSLGGVKFFRPRYLDCPRFGNYLNAYGRLLAVWLCIRRDHLKLDLIHAHFAHWMGYVGVLLAKGLKKPLILTVHGSDINVRPQFVPDRQRILFALRNSSRIIAVSDALKGKVLDMGIREKKVVTVYNGVDSSQFKPMDKMAARSRLGLSTAEIIILFVGNLHAVKGTRYLIRACSELNGQDNSFHLLIVGDGPQRAQLEVEVKRLGLVERVTFVGERPHVEIPWWMNACDVFVLPSVQEGFGIVLLEALACGKPVVATKVGGIPEVISDPSLGTLVEPANASQLAQAVAAALNRRWNAAALVNYARQYSWKRVAQSIYEQYERIS